MRSLNGNERGRFVSDFTKIHFQNVSSFTEAETKNRALFPFPFPFVSHFLPIGGKQETKARTCCKKGVRR